MASNDTNVVYIDTNLDTHLALVVSDLHTVSDLKKSILLEHPLCFPKFGQIRIHGVKVKHKSYFYHLSDSMLVRTAFLGSNKSWLLSVDAESAHNNREVCLGANNALIGHADNATTGSPSFDSFNLPQLENRLVQNEEIPVATPRVSEHAGKGSVEKYDTHVKSSDGNDAVSELPILNIECEVDASGKGIKNDSNNVREENLLISEPSTKKKRKNKMKKEDTVLDDNSKGAAAFVDNAFSFPFKGASSVNNKVPGSAIEWEVDQTDKDIKDACILRDWGNCKSVPSVKKKQKSKRKSKDTVRDEGSKENEAYVLGSGGNTIQQDIAVIANPSEVIKGTEVLKDHQHPDCDNNTTKIDIDAAVLMKKASETGPASNKKKRKRSLAIDSKEMLKVDSASQKDEVHMSDKGHKERNESKDWFELNNEKSRDHVEYQDNKVAERILYTGPPAKKKRKGKEKSGEKSLSKTKMIIGFNIDNASHHSLEDHQKIKNSIADQSGEHFNDTDPLRNSVQGKKRKGKINSSNPHETPVVSSSRKDEVADCSSIQRGIQEEISADGLFSKDISMIKTTIDQMETGTDACKEGIQSTEKLTGNYKNLSDIEIKAHTADVDEPMEPAEDDENVVLGQCHKNEVGQVQGAEEGRDVSSPQDSKLLLLEKSTSSNQDNKDANIRELNVNPKVVNVNAITEPIKSEKKKSGTRKAKNSGGGSALREGVGLVDAFESETVTMKSHSATNCDSMSENIETEENPLNQTEGEELKQQEVQGTSNKDNDFSVDKAGSLKQIITKFNAEHTDQRQRKKPNKQIYTLKKPSPSSDSGKHDKPSVVVTKKSKSTSSKKSTIKSSETNLELVEDSVRFDRSDSRFKSGGKDAAQHSTLSSGERDDDNLEAPSKTLMVNVDQQFLSWKNSDEPKLSDNMLVDKMSGIERTNMETMAGNNMHWPEATNEQTHAEDFSSSQQLSPKEELDVSTHPGKKVPNVYKTRQDSKSSDWPGSVASLIVEKRKARVNVSGKSMGLEKLRKRAPISNSKLEGSIKIVQNKAGKSSENNVHGVVSKTQQKKSLLAGVIFKDDSSSTSEDEVDNFDASTRTPSNIPLLSDVSDGDSSSGLDSQVDGSYGGGSLENGGSYLKESLSGAKGMKIDDVLRSSSRFKRARTTASQMEETLSQLEFVPDSLAE